MKKVSRSRLYDIRYVFQDLDRSYNLFYCKCPKLKNIISRALIEKL